MDDYRDLLPELDQELQGPVEDELICECHVVSLFHLRDLALEAGSVDLKLLQERTALGTGCGSCLKSKESWLKKLERLERS